MVDAEKDYQGHYLTSGRFVAIVVVAVCALGALDIVRTGDAGSDARGLLGLAGLCLFSYVLGLRPGVLEEIDGVLVRNPLRSTRVPWGAITNVDVTDVLRIHAGDQTIRCFAVPRRRPTPSRGGATSDRFGFSGMTPSPFGLGRASGGPLIGRADAVASRLREQAERYAVAGSGPVTTMVARDALALLGVAIVLIVVAFVVR